MTANEKWAQCSQREQMEYERKQREYSERFQREQEERRKRWEEELEQVKARFEITDSGIIDRYTGENVAPLARLNDALSLDEQYELFLKTGGSGKMVVHTTLYKCGDTGKYKRVSMYSYSPPPPVCDETSLMSAREFLSDLGAPEPREPFDRDFIEWFCSPSDAESVAEKPGKPVLEKRFRQSLSRARGMVQQYADSNTWDYFVTLTLDRNKQDRQNLGLFIPKFKKLMENIKRATGTLPQYVTVPELHKDNVSWHLHGLMNIPASELVEITDVYRVLRNGHYQWHMQDGSPIGYDTAKKFLKGGVRLFRWPRYERRFGFCTVEAVKSKDSVAAYCSKMFRYITETMSDDESHKKHKAAWKVLAKGKHLYYCSRGLKKYEKITPDEFGQTLSGAGLKAGKCYHYPYCEIQFYYTEASTKSQAESEKALDKCP